MNSQDFLILNVSCVALFVLWYWRSRGSASRKPTQLNMNAPDSAPLIIPPSQAQSFAGSASVARVKSLNVIFNYNGHSWDAYEVLGVPAGSQIPAVTEAYQIALKSSDPASHGFLETAYKAILHRF